VRTSAPLEIEALRRELIQGLEALGLAQAQVSITDVREIQRGESTGKIQRFVPLGRE
jgi:hypothetical protein